MPEPGASTGPRWTPRLPGSSALLFLLLSGGLWTGSLFAWEARQPELVVVLLGLAAFLPLVWLAVRQRTRPLWALQVREDRRRVADVVREALRDRLPTAIAPESAGHGGLFRGCETLFRLEDPACLLGVRRSPGEPWTTLLLLPQSKDREALDRLRASIAARVSAPG